jgi:hypothetical protein
VTLGVGIWPGHHGVQPVEWLIWAALPYLEADRIVAIGMTHPVYANPFSLVPRAALPLLHVPNGSFESVAAYARGSATLSDAGQATSVTSVAAEPSIFALLGTSPVLGRSFTETEDNVVVLTHAFWRTRFAEDRSVVGRSIRLNGEPVVMWGVA